ncbi:putative methyltransferase PMT27 [Hordeum vulgare]|nr:putative methyltransferase PMT27 [Hordeum vulgare]
MVLPAKNDDNGGKFTMHHLVDTDMRGNDLSVVYTNESVSVESSIQTMELLLAEDKYQVVCFDLDSPSVVSGKIRSTNNKHNSLVDPSWAIIDPYYMKMKDESKKDKNASHNVWDQRLDEQNVKYVAKDAYTSYELYREIIDMRKFLRPTPHEGSSHRAVAGRS